MILHTRSYFSFSICTGFISFSYLYLLKETSSIMLDRGEKANIIDLFMIAGKIMVNLSPLNVFCGFLKYIYQFEEIAFIPKY